MQKIECGMVVMSINLLLCLVEFAKVIFRFKLRFWLEFLDLMDVKLSHFYTYNETLNVANNIYL